MFTFDGEMICPDDRDFRDEILESYYRSEYRSLNSQVEQGTLSLQRACRGELFILPLDSDPFAVAVMVNGVIIRSGDTVELARAVAGQPEETLLTPVGGFRLNSKGEIDFSPRELSSSVGLYDIRNNASASSRALLKYAQQSSGKILTICPGVIEKQSRLSLVRA